MDVSYNHVTRSATFTEVLVNYHVQRNRAGSHVDVRSRHGDIMNDCADGMLKESVAKIAEWAYRWAPGICAPTDGGRPEIALFAKVTSKGNLDVTWAPVMTHQEYDATGRDFRIWCEDLTRQPIARRRTDQLYFIHGFDRFVQEAVGPEAERYTADAQLTAIATLGLHAAISGIRSSLIHMVDAHWQDILDIRYEASSDLTTPTPSEIMLRDAWTHWRELSRESADRVMQDLGTSEALIEAEWQAVSVSNPRVRTDEGRARVVASVIGTTTEHVLAAKGMIAERDKWAGRPPREWWNRISPYMPPWY